MNLECRKALIFGKNGQLAWELQRTVPSEFELTALGSAEINLVDAAQVADAIGEYAPDLVINAAAYTAVDKAETERDAAFALNRQAVANIADALIGREGTALVHVSTDFVFDGEKSSPYTAEDKPNPVSVYGASKLAGESEIRNRDLGRALILRTSWVYSSHGNNFVKTMLRLMSDLERDHLNVVTDQFGTPTWAHSLAKAIWHAGLTTLDSEEAVGAKIYHWSDAGAASWYDFAVGIQELALERQILKRKIAINPIPHTAYPTPAARPSFSVLDKSGFEQTFGVQPAHWREQLGSMLQELVPDLNQESNRSYA